MRVSSIEGVRVSSIEGVNAYITNFILSIVCGLYGSDWPLS